MGIISEIKPRIAATIKELYGLDIPLSGLTLTPTKPEFEGDYTLVLFSFVKQLKKSPEELGKQIGEKIVADNPNLFSSYNVIKGFLNLTITDHWWIGFLNSNYASPVKKSSVGAGKKVMVEYSSPNSNKPLHLGHLRNNFLGWSIAEILKNHGYEVVKSCIVNDRGIHVCKSMIAWKMFANGATPESAGKKGDHFVGDYYVKFNEEYEKQVAELVKTGMAKEEAEKEAPIMKATQEMLQDWEAGKPEIVQLWKMMNRWVYSGFEVTYKRIGSDFDKIYYESETYLPGKRFVEQGLKDKVFNQKPDGSIWIDLSNEGMDEKLVLRKDGTSVYITQDLGLAEQKYQDFHYDQSIYVIGDEQNYYMKVLKIILQKLSKPYADGIYHLSYGMVDLPTGRMKSREGTVVDADDLLDEMVSIATKHTEESGKVKDFTAEELKELYEIIGLGALKFFLMRVDPKKRMVFNPEESVDFHGFTGPFVQYTHARIKSILRKAGAELAPDSYRDSSQESGVGSPDVVAGDSLLKPERDLIIMLEQYAKAVDDAMEEHNPSLIAIYVFNLAKSFNTFYTELSVLNAQSEEKKRLRLQLSEMTAHTIKAAMGLLGIAVPERM